MTAYFLPFQNKRTSLIDPPASQRGFDQIRYTNLLPSPPLDEPKREILHRGSWWKGEKPFGRSHFIFHHEDGIRKRRVPSGGKRKMKPLQRMTDPVQKPRDPLQRTSKTKGKFFNLNFSRTPR